MSRICTVILFFALLFAGCGVKNEINTYQKISQDEAWKMMQNDAVVILDVREKSEFDELHITGAVLLPVGSITEDTAAAVIPNYDTKVLVYCRSGNRSQTAASALTALGYSNVYEFGGISTWPYEVE